MKLICAEKTTFSRRQRLRSPFNKRRRLLLERCAKRQHFVYVKIAVARLTAEPRTTRPLQTARKCIREQLNHTQWDPKKFARARKELRGALPSLMRGLKHSWQNLVTMLGQHWFMCCQVANGACVSIIEGFNKVSIECMHLDPMPMPGLRMTLRNPEIVYYRAVDINAHLSASVIYTAL